MLAAAEPISYPGDALEVRAFDGAAAELEARDGAEAVAAELEARDFDDALEERGDDSLQLEAVSCPTGRATVH